MTPEPHTADANIERQEKTFIEHKDRASDGSQTGHHDEKHLEQGIYPTRDEDIVVTFKTWIVVFIMASAYGVFT